MKTPVYKNLFKPLKLDGLRLKNRITMTPLLWVDPEWPRKAWKGDDRSILKCSPKCDACMQLVMQGKPAYCPKWSKEKRALYRELFQ